MKRKGLDMKMKTLFLLLGVMSVLLVFSQAYPKDKFRLKPGATGKLCTTCHAGFQEKLKSRFVHTPVKTGNCSSCHNPHASDHGKLLDESTDKVCFKCHPTVVGEKAVSSHKVVLEGNCVLCHDPHASENKDNLLRAGNDLCFGCHSDMGEELAKYKFKHSPVKGGCIRCHNPHSSSKASSLLSDKVPGLCLKCHKTDTPTFKNLHMNYPVAKADCTTCHNPHGSAKSAILYDRLHMPVANKMCNQCHEEPSSRDPFGLKNAGYEVCKGCHYDLVNDAFAKNRIHWPLVDRRGCINCHTPHASKNNALLREPAAKLCGNCHADTMDRHAKSGVKHQPVSEGMCTTCHASHASNDVFILKQSTVVSLCGACHDWQAHSTHPIGEKAVDPRNKNVTLQCLSCHRSHGTGFNSMLYYEATKDLCVQCHVSYRR